MCFLRVGRLGISLGFPAEDGPFSRQRCPSLTLCFGGVGGCERRRSGQGTSPTDAEKREQVDFHVREPVASPLAALRAGA